MSEPQGPDPLDELRRVDPVDMDQLPSASLARMSARIQEKIVDTKDTGTGRRRFMMPAAAVVLAGIALIVVVAGTRPGPAPAATPGTALASQPAATAGVALGSPISNVGSASCIEQYSPQALADRSFAFDGTVDRIDGDEVTFQVGRWFKGAARDTVTLTATGMTGTAITSAGGPNLSVGGRFLVAGEDHFAWPCGFTQPYDPAVATQWAQATGN